MFIYPSINPIALQLGPLAVHWYGLTYLIGLGLAWCVLALRLKMSPSRYPFTQDQLSDIIFYGALGLIVGGRIGYMLFYDWSTFSANPLTLFQIWKGGMSFHGGVLGVVVGFILCAKKIKHSFVEISDFIVPAIPIGLATGRIGNFINGELSGRVTDVPWAMVFPHVDHLPRHPSQLYEFLFEGVILFVILWLYSKKPRPAWAVSGLFLILYAIFRFALEFFRQPDAQIGFVAFGWLTKGQLLSLPMMIFGIIMLFCAYRRKLICNNI